MPVTVPLNRGKSTVIDDADAELVGRYHWWAVNNKTAKRDYWYAATKVNGVLTHLHVLLLGRRPGFYVDHENRDGLDNRRENLRWATRAQNRANSAASSASGFKGVYKRGKYDRWEAHIRSNGKIEYLGAYDSPEEAAMVYDTRAREVFGSYARLNFPEP